MIETDDAAGWHRIGFGLQDHGRGDLSDACREGRNDEPIEGTVRLVTRDQDDRSSSPWVWEVGPPDAPRRSPTGSPPDAPGQLSSSSTQTPHPSRDVPARRGP